MPALQKYAYAIRECYNLLRCDFFSIEYFAVLLLYLSLLAFLICFSEFDSLSIGGACG